MKQLALKENSEFKPIKLRLKIDHVSYPAQAEGLVNMNNIRYDPPERVLVFTMPTSAISITLLINYIPLELTLSQVLVFGD